MRRILITLSLLVLDAAQANSGCDVDPNSSLFTSSYSTSSQADAFGWTLTLEPRLVENNVGWPNYQWMPDGHISTIWDKTSQVWYVFYPNHMSFRTVGASPLPQDATSLSPAQGVFGGHLNTDAYNNGGEWLMSVHATDDVGGLIGFVHSEDRFYTPGSGLDPSGMAYKSVSLACSQDWGQSWQSQGQILTLGEKPGSPAWSGTGDQDVIWDWQNQRWFMMTHMSGAVSYSKNAEQSSWLKWDGRDFTLPSLDGPMENFTDSNGDQLPSGANPSIHWNSYLQLWVMVYHGWNGNIYITSAKTLPNFAPARVLMQHNGPDSKLWYPTLMSKKFGDRRGGKTLLFYYRFFPNGVGNASQFILSRIKFCRDQDC